jgi:hypothetical protein
MSTALGIDHRRADPAWGARDRPTRLRRLGAYMILALVVASCSGGAVAGAGTPAAATAATAVPVAPASPATTAASTKPLTSSSPAPVTPSTSAPGGGGDVSLLFGVWASDDAKIEFDADGTYIRVTNVAYSYSNVAIDEEGTYRLGDGTVIFTPTGGHYRRDGVDEGFDLTVTTQTIRLQPNADGSAYDLVLDDAVWTKEPS